MVILHIDSYKIGRWVRPDLLVLTFVSPHTNSPRTILTAVTSLQGTTPVISYFSLLSLWYLSKNSVAENPFSYRYKQGKCKYLPLIFSIMYGRRTVYYTSTSVLKVTAAGCSETLDFLQNYTALTYLLTYLLSYLLHGAESLLRS